MAIDFCIGSSFDDAAASEINLTYLAYARAELKNLLEVDEISSELKLLIELDPYEVTKIDKRTMEMIVTVIDKTELITFDDVTEKFLVKLQELFRKALEENKLVYAIGD